MTHAARIPYQRLAPKAFQGMLDLSAALRKDLLGVRHVDLVFLRVSQINGCAFCTDMHWRDLLRHDVDPRHANAVAAWRDAPFFSSSSARCRAWLSRERVRASRRLTLSSNNARLRSSKGSGVFTMQSPSAHAECARRENSEFSRFPRCSPWPRQFARRPSPRRCAT